MIRVEDLQKSFGDVRAVDRVSFSIERGEVVGFLGPNGAGKSTTMRILTGYLRADDGVAEIAGHPVERDDLEARRQVGYLPESTALYNAMRVDRYLDFVGSVRGLGRGARRDALERVVEQCGLSGYVGRRIGTLSKGYRQRVGLAQALFADPQVLVLDEPTSGLDPAEIVRIRALVSELGEHKTVLLSTHILSEVQQTCKRVIILSGGRVVADGTPLDLASKEQAGLQVTLRAPGAEASEALRALPGVIELENTGTDDCGRVGFHLCVDDRGAVAEAVARLVALRDWGLVELRHEVPSIETVFLRRTALRHAPADPAGPFAGGSS